MNKKVWICYATDTRPWDTPGWASWYLLLDGTPMTKEEALDALWDERVAVNTKEEEFEPCIECEGEGCEECDGTGGWYEDYVETVERHTYAGLEEYNPEVHYKVPSDRPEYLVYVAKLEHEEALRVQERHKRNLERLRQELMETSAMLEAAADRVRKAEVELFKAGKAND